MDVAEAIVTAARMWGTAGALVALAFLAVGIDRIDEDARGAYAFRLLLVPAVVLVWPLILWRWWVLETGRDRWAMRYRPPRETHFVVAILLLICIVTALTVGMAIRQDWPVDYQPQLMAP